MNVFFSASARRDLQAIVQYISQDKPEAARNWAESIKESVMMLADYPRAGRVVPEYADESLREIVKGQYRIVYKIDEQNHSIIVVAVHHANRLM